MSILNVRSAIGAQEFLPYEALRLQDRWTEKSRAEADRVIRKGWRAQGRPPFLLTPPIAWNRAPVSRRTWSFHLHSWDFLASVLATHSRERDPDLLDWALAVALDWAEKHSEIDPHRGMAWYDMAIGMRAYRLGYLLDAAAREPHIGDADVDVLLRCARLHLKALAQERAFNPDSNHGFYVAAGQLVLTRRMRALAETVPHAAQARERALRLVHSQFPPDGVHREHSPSYHLAVSEAFLGLLDSGLLDPEEFGPLLDRIQECLAWFILPNGSPALFGDSAKLDLRKKERPRVDNTALRFALSGGHDGKPPGERWRAFTEAGYYVARDRWPDGPDDFGDCSYLAQIAGFHSGSHKHADDLSVIWYDRGHEILVDAGKFGYPKRAKPGTPLWKAGFSYNHPSRIYVESTRAHNTVEIDGVSYQRRGVTPYGSGLYRAGEHDGVLYSGTHVRHRTTTRFASTVRHSRVLAFHPGEWLLVHDLLRDPFRKRHSFTQHFHFSPELEVAAHGAGFRVAVPGEDLHVVPLLGTAALPPVRGQEEPELLGWVSPRSHEFVPCWTTAFRAERVATCAMATLLAFGGSAPVPLPSSVPGELRWAHEGQEWSLIFGVPERDDFAFHASVRPASVEVTEPKREGEPPLLRRLAERFSRSLR